MPPAHNNLDRKNDHVLQGIFGVFFASFDAPTYPGVEFQMSEGTPILMKISYIPFPSQFEQNKTT